MTVKYDIRDIHNNWIKNGKPVCEDLLTAEWKKRIAEYELPELTADRNCIGPAKLVAFCNAPEDNPFMAGAFCGIGEPETAINVGVSGPGVVASAIRRAGDCNLSELADVIKKTAFKITRVGQLVANEAARRLDTPFGIVDLSLAPTPAIGDSVAHILEGMGLERCGTHGTTANAGCAQFHGIGSCGVATPCRDLTINNGNIGTIAIRTALIPQRDRYIVFMPFKESLLRQSHQFFLHLRFQQLSLAHIHRPFPLPQEGLAKYHHRVQPHDPG